MVAVNPEFAMALPIIKGDGAGGYRLAGSHCHRCGATMTGERRTCPACGGRGTIDAVDLGLSGTLHSYTVVYRSYPGVKTPFVSAIVDLHGGGSLRGTLIDVDADPAKLPYDMPVEVVFRDTGQHDPEGKPFLSYYFTPANGASR